MLSKVLRCSQFYPGRQQASVLLCQQAFKPTYAYRRLRYSSTTHSISSSSLPSRLNPPVSTRPPPLEAPTRTSDQSAPSYYFQLGRAYLTFYKTGLKAVYTNFQISRSLLSRLPSSTTLPLAVSGGLISRAELQLIKRSRHDVARIPLFALVVMVCGEFTPLVVLFIAGVVPGTCRIPKQIQGSREKLEERRRRSFREGTLDSRNAGDRSVKDLEKNEIMHVGRSLGLYSSLWDQSRDAGLVGFPLGLLRGRVSREVVALEMDDYAIKRDGGVGGMDSEEVRIAAEARGLDVLGKNDGQLKKLLNAWLQAKEAHSITKLLLTRPSVWQKE